MINPQRIWDYFGVYEGAYLREFGMPGFAEPGGKHTPTPFLGVNRCIGQLVDEKIIEDKPALVLGSGDSRVNVILNIHERDSYGLESNVDAYRMGCMAVNALRGMGQIRQERPIVLAHGDFLDTSIYEAAFGLPLEAFSTVYHYDGTGNYHQIQSVAGLIAHGSRPGTVLLLASHNPFPFPFSGLSCNRTQQIWGKRNGFVGMYVHVYKSTRSVEEPLLKKKQIPVTV